MADGETMGGAWLTVGAWLAGGGRSAAAAVPGAAPAEATAATMSVTSAPGAARRRRAIRRERAGCDMRLTSSGPETPAHPRQEGLAAAGSSSALGLGLELLRDQIDRFVRLWEAPRGQLREDKLPIDEELEAPPVARHELPLIDIHLNLAVSFPSN